MPIVFELVVINSSNKDIFLTEESLQSGTSDVHTRALLIRPKGVQRYKFKGTARNILEGTVMFRVEDERMGRNLFTVDFYHLNNAWAAVEMPLPNCLEEFQKCYILDGTTFLNKKTLSMAVEFSNITEKG